MSNERPSRLIATIREVLVVVAGILVVFGSGAASDQGLERRRETEIVESLREEFRAARDYLDGIAPGASTGALLEVPNSPTVRNVPAAELRLAGLRRVANQRVGR
jgi:hypothetical protein